MDPAELSPLSFNEELNRHNIFPHTLMQNGVIFCSKPAGYCRLYNLLFCYDAAVHHRFVAELRARAFGGNLVTYRCEKFWFYSHDVIDLRR